MANFKDELLSSHHRKALASILRANLNELWAPASENIQTSSVILPLRSPSGAHNSFKQPPSNPPHSKPYTPPWNSIKPHLSKHLSSKNHNPFTPLNILKHIEFQNPKQCRSKPLNPFSFKISYTSSIPKTQAMSR